MTLAFNEEDIPLGCVHQCQDTGSNGSVIINASNHYDTQILHTAFYNFPTRCHYY
jgi:hypothetical protein